MTSNTNKFIDNTEGKFTEDCNNDFDSKSWITITTLDLNDRYNKLNPGRWILLWSVWNAFYTLSMWGLMCGSHISSSVKDNTCKQG